MMMRSRLLLAMTATTLAASAVLAAETKPSPVRIDPPIPVELAGKTDALLAKALTSAKGDAVAMRKALVDSLSKLAADLPTESDPARTLRRALDAAGKESTDAEAVDRLAAGINEARASLTFQPTMEAPLPEGFPAPGPIGKVIVKQYPAYRLAKTAMGDQRQDAAFWTLFQHIQTNNIEMTAPVEMTYAAKGDKPQPTAMAFLYQSQKLGNPGEQGKVQVMDIPAMTVASVGVRGNYTNATMKDALQQIDAWLATQKDYERAGEPRYMGYNSPMVLPIKRYGEVQVPLKKK